MMRLTIEAGDDKELLQLVKQNGMITDTVDDDGSTLLHIAAIKGQLGKLLRNIILHINAVGFRVHETSTGLGNGP